MTESKKALAIAAGLAGVAGAATLAAAPNTVSASTGTVTYADGATTVWQTPAFKSVKRYVVKDQSIAVLGQKTVNGTVWYQIGAGEWIPELYLQVDGATAQATSTANVKTATTTTATDTFAVEATYTEGAVTIWNGTNYSDASGKYLTTDAPAQAVATVQANGETWYKLSNGGYVPARFAAKAGSVEATAAKSAATTAKAATTATAATTTATAAKTTTTPAADTTSTTGTTAEDTAATAAKSTAAQSTTAAAPKATTTTAATTAQSTTTTAAAQTTATPKTTATTATTSKSITVTYTDSVVTEWKSAAYSQAAGKYLAANTTVTAVGTTTVNGETWYQLSDGNFVSARFFGDAGKANSKQTTATSAKTTTATPAKTTTAAAPAKTTTQTSAPKVSTPAKTTTTAKTTTPAKTTTNTQATTSASANGTRAARIAAVINVAKAQLGKPYVWGGKGPNGFDCSGLARYAYLYGANKNIGGYTGAQQYAGTRVSLNSLQVGDLIFWGSYGSPYHVAIYLGGNQYINAPQPGENVKIASISSYFMPSFAVRVL